MRVDEKSSLLHGVRRIGSPNCDDRPQGTAIDLVVLHCISLPPGEFGGAWIDDLFTNTLDPDAHPYFAEIRGYRVSAHLLIRRNGLITQYVPFDRRAWHAGQSAFAGRRNCNDYSIGIELEGSNHIPYADAQYQSLIAATAALMAAYKQITVERIVGHADVAPGRKTDPGSAFEWRRLRTALAG